MVYEIYGRKEQPHIYLDRSGIGLLYMSRLSALHFSRVIVARIGGKMFVRCRKNAGKNAVGWDILRARYIIANHLHFRDIMLALNERDRMHLGCCKLFVFFSFFRHYTIHNVRNCCELMRRKNAHNSLRGLSRASELNFRCLR